MQAFLRASGALFNVQRGEGRLLTPLLALSFCLGLTRLFTQTAAAALFLVTFGIEQLPLVYIGVALAIPLLGLLYDRIGGRLALPRLLLTTIAVMAAALAALWLGTAFTTARWPAFALAIWYEVIWAMTSLCLWGLAGGLLNVRQGKRLFGLISAGDVLAATIGGLLTPAIVARFGTPSLLLGSLLGLLGAALLVRYITRAFAVDTAPPDAAVLAERRRGGETPVQRRYMALVLTMTMVSYIAFYFIDNLFYRQLEARYPNEEQLASFLGIFWAVVNGLTLLSNLFLVSPLYGRFGMRGGLLLLPLVTGLIAMALAASGIFGAAPAIFFWLVVLLTLLDWAISETTQKAGLLILYQPLPVGLRLRLQARVESIGQPVAQGLAGLTLLGLLLLGVGDLQLLLILLVILAGCVALCLAVSGDYLRVLLQALAARRLDGVTLAVSDSDSAALVARGLSSPQPGTVIYALDTLEAIGHASLADGLRRALAHGAAEVRVEALARIERLGLGAALAEVRRLAAGDPSPQARGHALRTLAILDAASLPTVAAALEDPEQQVRLGALVGLLRAAAPTGHARLAELARSPLPAERALAAQALGRAGDAAPDALLAALLADPEPDVRRAAIKAAGALGRPACAPQLLEALAARETHSQAAGALAAIGAAALPALAAACARPGQPAQTTIRVLRVAGRIGGPDAVALLEQVAAAPARELRPELLLALNRCGFRAGAGRDAGLPRLIEAEVAEMAALLHAQAALAEASPAAPPGLVDLAIEEAVAASRERLLLALACLYDATQIGRVRAALAHPAAEQRAYGAEALDNLVAQEHRPLVALLADEQPPAQRLRQLGLAAPRPGVRPAWLHALAAGAEAPHSPWVRACARAELARAAGGAGPTNTGASPMLSPIERVLALKSVDIFAGIPTETLAAVAALLEEQELAPGAALFEKGAPGNCMYVIVAGRLRVHDDGRLLNELGPCDVVGEMALFDAVPRMASVEALEPTQLLQLDQAAFDELLADYAEVARGIITVLSRHLRARVQDVAELRARVRVLGG